MQASAWSLRWHYEPSHEAIRRCGEALEFENRRVITETFFS